jgi:hypothetical protein
MSFLDLDHQTWMITLDNSPRATKNRFLMPLDVDLD